MPLSLAVIRAASSARLTPSTLEQGHGTLVSIFSFGTIHRGPPQNFRDFGPPPFPCPHFVLISSAKFTQPPLLCLLLGQPPLHPLVQTSFMNGPFARFLTAGAAVAPSSFAFSAWSANMVPFTLYFSQFICVEGGRRVRLAEVEVGNGIRKQQLARLPRSLSPLRACSVLAPER